MRQRLLLGLLCLAEAVPQRNLEGKVFLFPKRSASSYVILKPSSVRELVALTACLRFFSDVSAVNALFSAASRDHSNEILIYKEATGYEVSVANQAVFFKTPQERSSSRWETVCMTWVSATGIIQLWLNGRPLPRKAAAKGYRIKQDLIIMLGQDQDSYGGSLDAKQAFEGELSQVYLWDTVLPTDQLRNLQRQGMPVPLLDWSNLSYEIKGDVMLEPILF